MRWLLLLQALVWLGSGCHGYRSYQDEIPNGGRVPHPCKDNVLWHGVGHLNVQGGGARNVFGLDFAAAGRRWTRELCMKDSDDDGRSNGQELGDPQCIWTKGDIPQSTTQITHPGICDPYDQTTCGNKAVPQSPGVAFGTQEQWMQSACVSAEFDCPATKQPDVQQLDLRMPVTSVPPKETTYMCMTFDWHNVSADFHVIATEPIINNSYVMHHMLLFGCSDNFPAIDTPRECGMGGCTDLLGAWALGVTGQCFHGDAGVLMGRTGSKRLMIQYHWNNPQRHGHFQDSSGMRLYFTQRLRPNNMAMLMTGQSFLQIPPRSPHTLATADCSSVCTNNIMAGDIHVTTAANHMHYLGTAMNLELHRNSHFFMNLTNDVIYNYDTPKFYEYADPVVIHPGDMIRTTCHFSSLDKAVTTFEGDGTSDEMCFGFLTFYPKENMRQLKCVSWRGLSSCDPATEQGCDRNVRMIFMRPEFSETDVYKNITSVCKPLGPCSSECKTALRALMQSEPCFSNQDALMMLKWYLLPRTEAGRAFLAAASSCELQLYKDCLTDYKDQDQDDAFCRKLAGGGKYGNNDSTAGDGQQDNKDNTAAGDRQEDNNNNDGTDGSSALRSTSPFYLAGLVAGTLYHTLL